MRRLLVLLCLAFWPAPGWAEGPVKLYAPEGLVDSGLMRHILPRFSLKTQVRVELVADPAAADMVIGAEGVPVFEGAGGLWHMAVTGQGAEVARFADWLTSEVGMNAVTSFAPDGTALFTAPQVAAAEAEVIEITGDAVMGLDVSRTHCARCHRVETGGGMTGIGSTPSFALLRAFPDWETRFVTFYVLKPHGAFTQVEGVTQPFPIDRPSPIVPVEMTMEEVEAVMAYVAAMEAADLGAPLAHQ